MRTWQFPALATVLGLAFVGMLRVPGLGEQSLLV